MSIINKIFEFKINMDKSKLPDFDKLHDFGQIISIFDYLFNPNVQISTSAAETIHRIFTQENIFQKKDLYRTFKYLKINESDIDKFEHFPIEIRTTILCITSLNSN